MYTADIIGYRAAINFCGISSPRSGSRPYEVSACGYTDKARGYEGNPALGNEFIASGLYGSVVGQELVNLQ